MPNVICALPGSVLVATIVVGRPVAGTVFFYLGRPGAGGFDPRSSHSHLQRPLLWLQPLPYEIVSPHSLAVVIILPRCSAVTPATGRGDNPPSIWASLAKMPKVHQICIVLRARSLCPPHRASLWVIDP